MTPSAHSPSTLPEALAVAAQRFPNRGVHVLDRRGRPAGSLSYPELKRAVEEAAARLAARAVEPGDRVLICLPTSWDLLTAWFGTVLRGAHPVAMAPAGSMGGNEQQFEQLNGIVAHLEPKLLIGTEQLQKELARREDSPAGRLLITPAAFQAGELAPSWQPAPARPEDTAFLQLTSGSTGVRRAVVISHGAAVHNAVASSLAIGAPHEGEASTWGDAMVSWLPLYHDMGLVGCLLFSMNCGFDLHIMPPEAFLGRPMTWLKALGQAGVTIAPAPNFGYHLCVERLEEGDVNDLDLSSWRAAMVGAEMVRPETTTAFCELLAPTGFRPEAMRPCYGLAEGTLAVTFDMRGEGVRTRPVPGGPEGGWGLAEVSCVGSAVADTQVEVVDARGQRLEDDAIGEVRFRGPGLFDGYYKDEEGTAATLRDGWLYTGDLGFTYQGELYLSGRRKEVLIVRGHNVMPHELEWLADTAAEAGGSQRSGAFTVASGSQGEQAVLVMEVAPRDTKRLTALETSVRSSIGNALGLTLADLVFVRRGKIPKTTSGKVRRAELRRLYVAGSLDRVVSKEAG